MDSHRDPIPEASRFLTFDSDPQCPAGLRAELAALRNAHRVLRTHDRQGWTAFYEGARDAAQRALDELQLSPSAAVHEETGLADAMRRVRFYLGDLERVDRESIAYVQNDRVPRQRDSEIAGVFQALGQEMNPETKRDERTIVVEFPPSDMKRIADKAAEIAAEWHERVMQGLLSRIVKAREPVMQQMHEALLALKVEPPPLAVPKAALRISTPELPASAQGEGIPFGTALWQSFRSTYGVIITLCTMLLLPLLGLVLPNRDGGASSRAWLMLMLVPFLLVLAILLTRNAQREARAKLGKTLTENLQRDTQMALRNFADSAKKEIQSAIKNFAAEQDKLFRIWRYSLDRAEASVNAAPRPPLSRSGAETSKAYLAQTLEQRILPAFHQRLLELSALPDEEKP